MHSIIDAQPSRTCLGDDTGQFFAFEWFIASSGQLRAGCFSIFVGMHCIIKHFAGKEHMPKGFAKYKKHSRWSVHFNCSPMAAWVTLLLICTIETFAGD